LILKDRAHVWNTDPEIQALTRETPGPPASGYSAADRDRLLAQSFDRTALAAKGLRYERLDQLTMEVLLGLRG